MKSFFQNLNPINGKNKTLLLLVLVFILLFGILFYQLKDKTISVASISKSVLTEYDRKVEECKKRISQKNSDTKLAEFNNYKISPEYSGPLADPDINSNPLAGRYRTVIRDDLRKQGVNFAGQYTIAQWGATGIGNFMAVVDRINGKVYPFPYIIKTGIKFQKDSNLFIVDSLDDMLIDPCWAEMTSARTFYFKFNGTEFILIGPKNKPGPDIESNGWLDY